MMSAKEGTRLEFQHRRIRELHDISDIVELLFPGNRNQQHAAACILHELKWAQGIVPNLVFMQDRYNISRRTLQRTRAKLSRLGLIEHVSGLGIRDAGQRGWRLTGRFSAALRLLADKVDEWREDRHLGRRERELTLLGVFE
jgi:hypothetical protein